ncbi:hypothetical protein [Paenarthrobacter aurescens]|uniref:Membrane protein n=2 Tax=Paenarthrobacter aurescens TaxID=43663 RepID=Q6SK17_PAEAU|nr:hypothetical protein [Paenarthrobacter aurescens]AAS20155.1 membrane protein [Paenarthrobacter aurescens]ABM10512.1 hypothetical protein AAur_pTC10112 [Paenarthrobacter aurescens TC1]
MGRMVVVGGEVQGRGLFGGNRTAPEWIGLSAAVGAALLVVMAGGSGIVSLIIAAVLVLTGIILTTPNKFSGHRSLGALFVESRHKKLRRRNTSLVYVPVKDRPHTRMVKAGRKDKARADAKGLIEVPVRHTNNAPLMVGTVRHFTVDTPDGPLVIFRHQGKVAKPYYTATMEIMGSSSAIREEYRKESGHVARGQYLARLARRQSLVTHVQSLARAVPMDSADHLLWVKRRVAKDVPGILLESYGALCETVRSRSEQHRTYETFRIPNSPALFRRADALGGGDEGIGQAVYQEIRSAMSQATMMGSIIDFRPLGPAAMAALLRHLQDPDFDIDDHDGADLMDCWQHLDGDASPLSLVVNRHWHIRIGYVPASAFSPQAIPVEALEAVISGIQPAVVHSVSMVMELQDARSARAKARSHAAMDRAKEKQVAKSGVVTDGSEEVLLAASHQRLLDLKPGSGHHGAAYALYISFAVENADEILSTTDIIEAAASDAGIEFIDWMDNRNDLALITTMPFTRGIR